MNRLPFDFGATRAPVVLAVALAVLACGAMPARAAARASAASGLFQLPTANRALFDGATSARFYAPTPGKTWTSGTYGCVRSEGAQFHEGIDILSLQKDSRGEPTDPVLAVAEGVVAYVNLKPELSNYGNYVILQHRVAGLEIYSLYAHLKETAPGLKRGDSVAGGQRIGTLGRTSNTRQPITKDRAHVHFELNFFLNDRFPEWYRKNFPDQRNDHGVWNGQNLSGLDPAALFLAQRREGDQFRWVRWIQSQPELCRVFVRKTSFPWLTRYPALVTANPRLQPQEIAGYELALSYSGMPVRAIARSAAEVKSRKGADFWVLSVNEEQQRLHPCRKLVVRRGDRWELASSGERLLSLLTY